VSAGDPVSPCIAVCVLDAETGFCRGCRRTIAEIAQWSGLPPEEKRRIIAELTTRKPRPACS
jgi:predicted Fe-S protein YdhL (DUF1289 family)